MDNPTTIATDPRANKVREVFLARWGKQTCHRPKDWPAVLGRLLKDAPAPGPGRFGRASLAALVDEAVATLAREFGDRTLPDDPPLAVWRAFPRLDRANCVELAALLIEARGSSTRSAA